MEVTLKVSGDKLHQTLSTAITTGVFPRSFRGEAITWTLTLLHGAPGPEDLLAVADRPCVLLLQAYEKAEVQQVFENLTSIEKRVSMSLSMSVETLMGLSPVILMLGGPLCLKGICDLPDLVSDWVFSPLAADELVRRIFLTLKAKRMLQRRMSFGPVVLSPITRTLFAGERSMRLSPSEFFLAEFFFMQMGSVVTSDTLIKFFESQEKSTKPNNIRVAIFQLRLKLEALTSSQVTLVNIYKKGYCLRLKAPRHGLSDGHLWLSKT